MKTARNENFQNTKGILKERAQCFFFQQRNQATFEPKYDGMWTTTRACLVKTVDRQLMQKRSHRVAKKREKMSF